MKDAKVWQDFWDGWLDKETRQETIDVFATNQCNFLFGLLPEQAIALTPQETIDILRKRYGKVVDVAPVSRKHGHHQVSQRAATGTGEPPSRTFPMVAGSNKRTWSV